MAIIHCERGGSNGSGCKDGGVTGPEFKGALNERFLAWLGDISLLSPWLVIVLNVAAVALLWHALARQRAGYRWWAWPLPVATLVLAVAAVAAINAWTATFPDVGSLVG